MRQNAYVVAVLSAAIRNDRPCERPVYGYGSAKRFRILDSDSDPLDLRRLMNSQIQRVHDTRKLRFEVTADFLKDTCE